MADKTDKTYEFRAKLPKYVRIAALAAVAIIVGVIILGFYRERNKTAFRLKPEHTQLSKDVIAEVNGYERLETDGEVKKFYVKADHAKTFSDNHQELDNVYIEVYGEGDSVDKLNAQRALYVPADDHTFTAYLAGDVGIQTRDSLKINTDNIVYTKKDETAVADGLVKFERANVSGQSFGANAEIAKKRLNLLRDVDVDVVSDESGSASSIRSAKFKGGAAVYDQNSNTLEVNGGIEAHLISPDNVRKTDVKAQRTVASLSPAVNGSQPSLKTIELFENVWIETTAQAARQSTIETSYAFYDKTADRFELKNGVHMVTGTDEMTDIKAGDATYDQAAGNLRLGGGAEITKGAGYLRGDALYAVLSSAKKVKNAKMSGSAYLRNVTADRTTEITADSLTADFDETQQPTNAKASGNAKATVTPTDKADYTLLNLTSQGALLAAFRTGGLPSTMKTDGRSTIQLNVPNGPQDAANKRVTADLVNVQFNDNGKDIKHAEAVGNAELYVDPLKASAQNYKTTIYAPRFDCEFFPGNNARECVGSRKTKTVREPTVSADNRGTQTLLADKLTASFSEGSKDVETLQADGQAKFSELDKNAVADGMSFTQSDQTVRLRGGEPTFWDANARAKAPEIDWDTRAQRSYMRGGVSTTYYSGKRTGDAAPFGSSDKPVFATSQSMELDQKTQTALFTGNARAWQDNNYVRGDRLVIDQQNGHFKAEGSVQSLLYEAKQKRKGASANVPVYAAAASLNYSHNDRVLQYRNSVDIRQGTDRLSAQSADIFLDQNNEMMKTVVEKDVVITQPGKKAMGDWAEYTAENEVAVLRGNPARVDDSENGSSQGGQITVSMRDNRVLSEGTTKQNPTARTRSVYKVKSNQ
jgi:lipopolysaccharide export system protein LptA